MTLTLSLSLPQLSYGFSIGEKATGVLLAITYPAHLANRALRAIINRPAKAAVLAASLLAAGGVLHRYSEDREMTKAALTINAADHTEQTDAIARFILEKHGIEVPEILNPEARLQIIKESTNRKKSE